MAYYQGVIKSFNPAKGWGFIECEDTQSLYGKDMFVLKKAIPGEFASTGDEVTFSVVEGKSGPEAGDVQFVNGGPSESPPDLVGKGALKGGIGRAGGYGKGGRGDGVQHYGTVKSFNAEKAWGFVTSPEILRLYGKDLFFMRNSVAGGFVEEGTQVSFTVVDGAKGPEASSILPQTGSPAVYSGYGRQKGARGDGAQNYGTIKSFNAEKAWGFVTSPEILSLYGKDLFFMRNSVVGGFVEEGTQVSFTVVEGAKGPEASSIQPMTGTPAVHSGDGRQKGARGMYGMGGVGGTVGMSLRGNMGMAAHRGGDRKGGCPPVNLSMPARMPVVRENQLFFGVVKSFTEEKGWGHIQCEAAHQAFGKDVFLLKTALGGVDSVTPGALVSFTVDMKPKGPQAQGISFLPPSSFGAKDQPGTFFSGTVKSFNAEKGWGFITSEEIQQIFGKDIFIHKKQLGDVVPSEGDVVQFSVEPGVTGNLEAKNVSMEGYTPIQRAPRGGCRSMPY